MVDLKLYPSRRRAGFTLIEMLVVLSIIMLLVGLAAPAHFNRLQVAKETVLQQNLIVMRASIDRYYTDNGQYPKTLQDLVDARYLASIPVDTIIEANDQWVLVPANEEDSSAPDNGFSNVKSGADGTNVAGVPYANF